MASFIVQKDVIHIWHISQNNYRWLMLCKQWRWLMFVVKLNTQSRLVFLLLSNGRFFMVSIIYIFRFYSPSLISALSKISASCTHLYFPVPGNQYSQSTWTKCQRQLSFEWICSKHWTCSSGNASQGCPSKDSLSRFQPSKDQNAAGCPSCCYWSKGARENSSKVMNFWLIILFRSLCVSPWWHLHAIGVWENHFSSDARISFSPI